MRLGETRRVVDRPARVRRGGIDGMSRRADQRDGDREEREEREGRRRGEESQRSGVGGQRGGQFGDGASRPRDARRGGAEDAVEHCEEETQHDSREREHGDLLPRFTLAPGDVDGS